MQKFGLQNFHTNKLTWDVQTFCKKRWISGLKQEMGEWKCEVKRMQNLSLMAKHAQESNMTSSWNSISIIYKIVHKSE